QTHSQNELLAEYEQKLTLVEKQFATFKEQIDSKKMSTMDIKMKVGSFENNRNSLKAKLKDLRKSTAPLSETDKGDLDKRFEQLKAEFEELKKIVG
ncbi:MAG TPA: hypothetical protein PKD91_15035, partial [Bacteroidia bacterium]|nr:hypothetical protein [Bacteroidia bacterium]